jgi:hypothetical protein
VCPLATISLSCAFPLLGCSFTAPILLSGCDV